MIQQYIRVMYVLFISGQEVTEDEKRHNGSSDQALQSLFEKRGCPGIAVTIRGPEGILFEKGYGYRDVEHQLPADTHTIFGIASMSKSITALCCAILATEGKLSLEDPITKYFPTLHIPGIPDGTRMLAPSTDGASGMVDCEKQPGTR